MFLFAAVLGDTASLKVTTTPLGFPAVRASVIVGAVVSTLVVVSDSDGPGLPGAAMPSSCSMSASNEEPSSRWLIRIV